jgi:hypothetical protein
MIWMALIGALLLIWFKRISGRSAFWNGIKFWFEEQVQAWAHERLHWDLAGSLAREGG